MKYILVAGGSGGHIYPCLSLAKYLHDKGESVLLIGALNSMEETIYKNSGLEFYLLNINKKKVKSFVLNYKKIIDIYKDFNPDGVILFGNYISFSFALMAKKMKIPIYLHEQNIVYGKANKLLGVFAKKIYLSLPIKHNIYKKKSLLVGNPKSDYQKKNKVSLNDGYNVFIVMGSLGSSSINKMLLELIAISNKNINYHIVTGKKHYDDFIKRINKKDNIYVYPYIEQLLDYTSECDLFVSRSGATTLLEIINYKIPSILIPSPYVANNHQYKNAMYLENHNAAYVLEEKHLTSYKLEKMIEEIVFDDKKRDRLRCNLSLIQSINSKEKIYKDLVNNERRVL